MTVLIICLLIALTLPILAKSPVRWEGSIPHIRRSLPPGRARPESQGVGSWRQGSHNGAALTWHSLQWFISPSIIIKKYWCWQQKMIWKSDSLVPFAIYPIPCWFCWSFEIENTIAVFSVILNWCWKRNNMKSHIFNQNLLLVLWRTVANGVQLVSTGSLHVTS